MTSTGSLAWSTLFTECEAKCGGAIWIYLAAKPKTLDMQQIEFLKQGNKALDGEEYGQTFFLKANTLSGVSSNWFAAFVTAFHVLNIEAMAQVGDASPVPIATLFGVTDEISLESLDQADIYLAESGVDLSFCFSVDSPCHTLEYAITTSTSQLAQSVVFKITSGYTILQSSPMAVEDKEITVCGAENAVDFSLTISPDIDEHITDAFGAVVTNNGGMLNYVGVQIILKCTLSSDTYFMYIINNAVTEFTDASLKCGTLIVLEGSAFYIGDGTLTFTNTQISDFVVTSFPIINLTTTFTSAETPLVFENVTVSYITSTSTELTCGMFLSIYHESPIELTISDISFSNCSGGSLISASVLPSTNTDTRITLTTLSFKDCSSGDYSPITLTGIIPERGSTLLNAVQSLSAQISNCTFYFCASNSSGGAITCENMADAIITSSTFDYCTSSLSGGALSISLITGSDFPCMSAVTLLDNCSFTECHTSQNGGAASLSSSCPSTISSSTFTNCSAENDGGSVYWSVLSNQRTIAHWFESCSFSGNTAHEHGQDVYISCPNNTQPSATIFDDGCTTDTSGTGLFYYNDYSKDIWLISSSSILGFKPPAIQIVFMCILIFVFGLTLYIIIACFCGRLTENPPPQDNDLGFLIILKVLFSIAKFLTLIPFSYLPSSQSVSNTDSLLHNSKIVSIIELGKGIMSLVTEHYALIRILFALLIALLTIIFGIVQLLILYCADEELHGKPKQPKCSCNCCCCCCCRSDRVEVVDYRSSSSSSSSSEEKKNDPDEYERFHAQRPSLESMYCVSDFTLELLLDNVFVFTLSSILSLFQCTRYDLDDEALESLNLPYIGTTASCDSTLRSDLIYVSFAQFSCGTFSFDGRISNNCTLHSSHSFRIRWSFLL